MPHGCSRPPRTGFSPSSLWRGESTRNEPSRSSSDEIFGVLAEEDAVQNLRLGAEGAGRGQARADARQRHLLGPHADGHLLAGRDRGRGARGARRRGDARVEVDLGHSAATSAARCLRRNSTCRRNRRRSDWPARRRGRAALPVCTMRPSRMMQTRSLIESASSWSWVTRMKVMPSERCRFCSSICISRRSFLVERGERLVEEQHFRLVDRARGRAPRAAAGRPKAPRRGASRSRRGAPSRAPPRLFGRAPRARGAASAGAGRRRRCRRRRDAGTARSAGTPC